MEVVWPACPLECDIIVRYLQPDLKTSFYSNYKLNIMSLHKCLHGQILMNNFPAAFITHLCRKVLSVYSPSDAMWWAPSPHSSNTFSCAQVIILFFSCHWRSGSSALSSLCFFVHYWKSSVGLKPFILVLLVGGLPVWSVCALCFWSVFVCEGEREQCFHRECERINSCVYSVVPAEEGSLRFIPIMSTEIKAAQNICTSWLRREGEGEKGKSGGRGQKVQIAGPSGLWLGPFGKCAN